MTAACSHRLARVRRVRPRAGRDREAVAVLRLRSVDRAGRRREYFVQGRQSAVREGQRHFARHDDARRLCRDGSRPARGAGQRDAGCRSGAARSTIQGSRSPRHAASRSAVSGRPSKCCCIICCRARTSSTATRRSSTRSLAAATAGSSPRRSLAIRSSGCRMSIPVSCWPSRCKQALADRQSKHGIGAVEAILMANHGLIVFGDDPDGDSREHERNSRQDCGPAGRRLADGSFGQPTLASDRRRTGSPHRPRAARLVGRSARRRAQNRHFDDSPVCQALVGTRSRQSGRDCADR